MLHAMLELVVELDRKGHQQRREQGGECEALIVFGIGGTQTTGDGPRPFQFATISRGLPGRTGANRARSLSCRRMQPWEIRAPVVPIRLSS